MFSCQILKMSRDGEWGFHDVSGQPVTLLNHCLKEEHFPYDQFELPFLQTVITIHCALTVHLSEDARFVLSTTLFSIALTRWLKRAIRIFLFSPYFPYPLKGHMLQLLTILVTSLWTHSQNWRLLQMQPHKCQAEVNHHFLWPTFDTFALLQELAADSNWLLSYQDRKILFCRASSLYQHMELASMCSILHFLDLSP